MQDIKERERQRQWINRKHKDMFQGSSHYSTSPPSHRKISTISSTQETSTEDLGQLRLGVHNSSLQPNTTSHRGNAQLSTPLHLEGQALSQTMINLTNEGQGSKPLKHNHLTLEGFQHNLHLSLEGAKQHFHNHLTLEGYQLNHLSLEGYHKDGSLQLGGLSQPQTNSFPTKQRS